MTDARVPTSKYVATQILNTPIWKEPRYVYTAPEGLEELYPGAFLEHLGGQDKRMVFIKTPDGNKCDKCGEYGHDRRRLRMACFYDMSEFNVPFDTCKIYGRYVSDNGDVQGNVKHHSFYTLLVCKACRGDWMQAIETWFNGPIGRR